MEQPLLAVMDFIWSALKIGMIPAETGHFYTKVPRSVHEVVKQSVVEEELGNQKIHAGIDLLLQCRQIVLKPLAVDMAFHISGCGDAEIIDRSYMFNELICIAVYVFAEIKAGLVCRRVAPERKYVFKAFFVHACQHRIYLFPGMPDTGEMGHTFNAVVVFYPGGNFYGTSFLAPCLYACAYVTLI